VEPKQVKATPSNQNLGPKQAKAIPSSPVIYLATLSKQLYSNINLLLSQILSNANGNFLQEAQE